MRTFALGFVACTILGGGGFVAGTTVERQAHTRARIRGKDPFTYLARKDKVVLCFEGGGEVDCRAWLARHFDDVCEWTP